RPSGAASSSAKGSSNGRPGRTPSCGSRGPAKCATSGPGWSLPLIDGSCGIERSDGPGGVSRPARLLVTRLAQATELRYSRVTMTPAFLLAAVLGAEPAPLAIDPPTVDRGELPANKPLVQAFRLKNTGSVLL